MENSIVIWNDKEQISEILPGGWYKILLSDDQLYSILEQIKKLQWWETSKEVFSVLSDIIYRIYNNLIKTPNYNPENMRNLSTRQLLTQKEVFFMNTCLEYSLLTLQYMKNAWFTDTRLILHELETPYKWFYKLHFGIEWIHDQTKYYIDHQRRNTVILWKWDFKSDYTDIDENVVNIIEIDSEFIWVDDTFPDLYKRWLIDLKYFSPDLLTIFKEKFKKDNTPDERQNWFVNKVQHPYKPEITIRE